MVSDGAGPPGTTEAHAESFGIRAGARSCIPRVPPTAMRRRHHIAAQVGVASARSGAQPADLSPMIDLVSEDVKPLEVVVDSLSVTERRLGLEPRVVEAPEFQKRRRADLFEPCEVVGEVVASN